MEDSCITPLCGKPVLVKSRRLCENHYRQWRRTANESELIKRRTGKHNMTLTPEYNAWRAMKQRCYLAASRKYKDYGGRGIKVHPEWLSDFNAFYAHVGERPAGKYSLDRIDNDGNYEPGNVRWATYHQQNKNKRNSR